MKKTLILFLWVFLIGAQAMANQSPTAAQVATNCSPWSKNLNCGMTNQQLVDNAVDQFNLGGGVWGGITGTLSNQTDLQNALNAKQNLITTGTIAQYLRGDLTLATFPTNLNQFTNGPGYITLGNLSAGTGIGIGTTGIITNTLPDQTVVLNSGTGISATGTYPNFTITNTSPSTGGTVTSVLTSAPLIGSITTSGTIGIGTASATTDGYLKQGDWVTFNNKQPAGSYLTTVTADAPLSGSGTAGSHLIFTNPGYITLSSLSATAPSTYNNSTGAIGINTTGPWNGNAGGLIGVGTYAVCLSNGVACAGVNTLGTVTQVSTTGPITGGPFSTTGTIGINTTGPWNGIPAGASATSPITFNPSTGAIGINTTGFSGTVTQVSTTGPITGGPFTTSGTIGINTTGPWNGVPAGLILTTTGSSGAATFSPSTGTLNVPQYTGGGSNYFQPSASPLQNVGISTFYPLGIGTTSPVGALEVEGTIPAVFSANTNSGVGIGTYFGQTGQGGILNIMGGNVGIGTWTPGALLDVKGTLTGDFYVMQNGDVGIGTIAPQTALAVNGEIQGINNSSANLSLVLINSNSSGLAGFRLQNSAGFGFDNVATGSGYAIPNTYGILVDTGQVLTFGNTSGSKYFFIDGSGNVGIGTVGPRNVFEVGTGLSPSIFAGAHNVGIGTTTSTQALTVGGNYATPGGTGVTGSGATSCLCKAFSGGICITLGTCT